MVEKEEEEEEEEEDDDKFAGREERKEEERKEEERKEEERDEEESKDHNAPDEVHEHVFYSKGIGGHDGGDAGVDVDIDREALGAPVCAKRTHNGARHVGEGARAHIKIEFALLNLGGRRGEKREKTKK